MEKILIDASGNTDWIGGLYYKKNILFSLLQNKYIIKKYTIIVVTNFEIDIFDEFEGKIILIKLKNKLRKFKIIVLCKLINIKYIYPSYDNLNYIFNFFCIKTINWIPDFQHKHLSLYFSYEELEKRDLEYNRIANQKNPLVLSSFDSLKDFYRYFNKEKKDVYVLPFVSYIEEEINYISAKVEQEILQKYNLDKKYICVMNQFWQHKNHIVVLQALREYLAETPTSNFCVVMTGKMSDYRNPKYIEKIQKALQDPVIKKHVVSLGFVNRIDQIVIMKNAEYIIQPSLFEGWGTVVEDAKVLDKTILLSDIPVHREQMNHKCILFDPHDPVLLSKLIDEENRKEHIGNVEAGIADMYKRAKEYSKGFEKLLRDLERK